MSASLVYWTDMAELLAKTARIAENHKRQGILLTGCFVLATLADANVHWGSVLVGGQSVLVRRGESSAALCAAVREEDGALFGWQSGRIANALHGGSRNDQLTRVRLAIAAWRRKVTAPREKSVKSPGKCLCASGECSHFEPSQRLLVLLRTLESA